MEAFVVAEVTVSRDEGISVVTTLAGPTALLSALTIALDGSRAQAVSMLGRLVDGDVAVRLGNDQPWYVCARNDQPKGVRRIVQIDPRSVP
jgi:hypothetical protein